MRARPPRSDRSAAAAKTLRRPTIARGREGPPPSHDALLQLQRDAGNAAVTTLVQRKAGAAAGDTVLRRRAKGERVRELQELLNESGLLPEPIGVDGDFGNDTVRAVRAVQAKLHLGVDGAAGPTTMARLRAAATQRAADVAAAGARADRAWEVAAAAHEAGKWEQALAAYAEVVTQAEASGDHELGAAAAARIREARLKRPPTPYARLRGGAGAKEEPAEVATKRAAADAQFKAGQYAAALASYTEVYAASGGGANELEDTWSIASCHHQLGHFTEAVSWYRQTATHFAQATDESFAMVVNERVREATLRKPPTPSAELKRRFVEDISAKQVDPADEARFAALEAKAAEGDRKFRARDVAGGLATFLEVYDIAAKFDYRIAEVVYNIGLCHHTLGHFDQAVEFYRQAREMNRGREWFITRLGELGGDAKEAAAASASTRDAASAQIAKALRHERP